MEKEKNIKKIFNDSNLQDNIKSGGELIGGASSVLSLINPSFCAIPLIVFAVNWSIGFISPKYIEKRLKKLSEKLEEKRISIDTFKKEISNLSEHNEYIVINHLRNMLISAIPETVNIYINLIVDFVMTKEYSMNEELCEIVKQLNKNDLELLKMIIVFLKTGSRENYELNFKKREEKKEKNLSLIEKNKKIEEHNAKGIGLSKIKYDLFYDRDIVNEDKTIFWKDFAKTNELEISEMGLMLLNKRIEENGTTTMKWAYLTKSFLKLEKLGLLELDYLNTFGTINSLNVERIHITLFGQELLNILEDEGDLI